MNIKFTQQQYFVMPNPPLTQQVHLKSPCYGEEDVKYKSYSDGIY